MFKCKVCLEKDKRISDLKEMLNHQNKTLTGMISPTYGQALTKEVNLALDGAGTEQLEMPSPEELKEISEIELQQIQMLSGNY